MFNQQTEDDKIDHYASELSQQSDKNMLQKAIWFFRKS